MSLLDFFDDNGKAQQSGAIVQFAAPESAVTLNKVKSSGLSTLRVRSACGTSQGNLSDLKLCFKYVSFGVAECDQIPPRPPIQYILR